MQGGGARGQNLVHFRNEVFYPYLDKSKRKAMNRNWYNQKANPALNAKEGNKKILQIDKIQ